MKKTKSDLIDDDVMLQLCKQARDFGKVGLSDSYGIRIRLRMFTKAELEIHLKESPGSSGRLCEISG